MGVDHLAVLAQDLATAAHTMRYDVRAVLSGDMSRSWKLAWVRLLLQENIEINVG